jgi:hypothetical protein
VIHFERVPEPAGFDAEVRERGRAWLSDHPAPARPRAFWAPYVRHLAAGFRHLCGYTAMHIEEGTVDHYRSCATHRDLSYEWDNYRYASARLNSIKHTADDRVLDPYEVGDDWFEVQLPSLQLEPTDRIPLGARQRSLFTLERLGLRDGAPVIRRRQAWYEAFLKGRHSLEGLRHCAPLLSRAVEKRLAGFDAAAFGAEGVHYAKFIGSELTLPGLKSASMRVFEAVEGALRLSA